MKNILRSIVPNFIMNAYHYVCAFFANYKYGFPAKKMFIVGVTGTKGKTSTSNYIWSVLDAGGFKTGMMTTANFRIGKQEEINKLHMSMPSAFIIQRKLREMLDAGIEVAVIEMTSEGMRQYRNAGIPVDVAVFTNLTPEHIASHGSFDAYKKAKSILFKSISKSERIFNNIKIPRTIIANADNEHYEYYLNFPADKKYTFGLSNGNIVAKNVTSNERTTAFDIDGEKYILGIPGKFNVYNALPAIIVGRIFSVLEDKIKKGILDLNLIPGRMEIVEENQPFTVIIDFAHEAASMNALLDSVLAIKKQEGRIILLSGATGGGRERKPMTEVGAKLSDILVLTTEDAYDDDPEKLVASLVPTATLCGKVIDSTLFEIPDRKQAIEKALSLAKPNDIVLITGKGGEQVMVTKNGAIPWDERTIVRKLTKKYAIYNN